MKKFLALALVVCVFASMNIFAAQDDADVNVRVITQVTCTADADDISFVVVQGSNYSPVPAACQVDNTDKMYWTVTATAGFAVSVTWNTTTASTPAGGPVLTIVTHDAADQSGSFSPWLQVTGIDATNSGLGGYTYNQTCSADYTNL